MQPRLCILPLLCSLAWQSQAQQQKPVAVQIVGHVYKPEHVPATEDRIRGLKLPAGFRVQRFASDLGKPRILAVAPDGA
ncbi:MAG: hypothetical protein K2X97_09150, partial [Mycobacteriaceae bacterium]|nr:hypothetical protein [Mycobacteriaceae bacterium]